MEPVYLLCAVLLLSSGALSADVATLGTTCTPGTDTCTINGAVCDKTAKTCVCNDGYVQSGSECAREHLMPCGRGICADMGKTSCDNNKCKCDSTKGLVASAGACACPANYEFHPTVKKCMKVRGATCTPTTDDCYTVPGLACTGTPKTCTCDTAGNFEDGTNTHSAACACKEGFGLEGTVCRAIVGIACSAASPCESKLVCDTTCKCDAAKHYVAPGDDNTRASACACTPSTYAKVDSGDCRAVVGTTCSATSICEDGLVCDTTCKCDAAKNYAAGTAGDRAAACTCLANYQPHPTAKKCMKERGQSCSTTADCYTTPGLVCTSGTCTCDTAGNFENGANTYSTACACKTGYVEVDGVCKAKVSRACTTTTDCDPGLVCDSKVCKCDATKRFVAPGTTDSRFSDCACITGHTVEGTACNLNVGQDCTRGSSSVPCVYQAVCSKETDKCVCDAARGYKANAAGTACECLATYTLFDDILCLAPLDSTCSSSCISGAACFAGNDTLSPVCLCNGAANTDGTCSSAVGLFASLSSLMAALFVAWRLM